MILDTNALSAFADGDRELIGAIGKEPELAVPVVVLGEYLYGIRQSRFRPRYEEWLRRRLGLFHVLPVRQETAGWYAEIRRELKEAGKPIPSNDVWIAALAREHRLAVVSRDTHFGAVSGLRLMAW
ncbi:MAG: type II toxin-antitoxin system VapC family toxin [bacterium]|nr:type II toxin-antitoxin system VapC family toxin [bacterium]